MKEEVVEKLRSIVRDCVSKHLYSSAIFFADKVAAMTLDTADIYMQAQALFLGGHYRRALNLLTSSHIVDRDLRFRYLAAKCLEEVKDWHQCLSMLEDVKVDEHGIVSDAKDCKTTYMDKDVEDHEINILSAIYFIRGKAYEALENLGQAKLWYQAAFKEDPLCYEALERLIDNYMLTCEEESSLLSSITFSSEDQWLSTFYSCLLKKYEKEHVVEAKFKELEKESYNISSADPSLSGTLKNNSDLLACKAEYFHQCGEYQKCYALTSTLLQRDPYHLKCTLIHLVAAMELGRFNDLYLIASDLVKDYPQRALSWFAVGCYYYCIKKLDQARRYFSKAASLDGTFAPALVGAGNAFSALEEGEQAMAAFRTGARIFPGCHLPALYIGMEYMRTHNFKLAKQAKAICPLDPLVLNELGVVTYYTKEYQKSVRWFEMTLANIPSPLNEIWEPTFVNHAHALRKLKRYSEAITYYEKALALNSRSLSAYSGLAYTYHIQDNYDGAITYYHKALWLKPDDQFCSELLSVALCDEGRARSSDTNMPLALQE